jgi:hypothetical protein
MRVLDSNREEKKVTGNLIDEHVTQGNGFGGFSSAGGNLTATYWVESDRFNFH